MMNKPLQKDLADILNIDRAKRINFTYTGHGAPKDITIGLLDGPYSNHLDIIHFENTIDILGGILFTNQTASFYRFKEFILKSKIYC